MIIKLNKKIIVISILIVGFVSTTISFVYTLASGAEDEGVRVPAIMYHHVLNDKALHGKYVVPTELFEADMKYLIEQGYTAVFISDLIDYVEGKKELPPKPILITFDDGYATVDDYVLPILQKYKVKAIVSIVGSYTDKYSADNINGHLSYNNLSWAQVKKLSDSGFVEIQNHSYDMHGMCASRKGIKKNRGESEEEYKKSVTDDIMKNQQKIAEVCKKTPTCFTYPFGYITKQSDEFIKSIGVKATLSCRSGVSKIVKGNKDSLFHIKRYNRPFGEKSEDFFAKTIEK